MVHDAHVLQPGQSQHTLEGFGSDVNERCPWTSLRAELDKFCPFSKNQTGNSF